jgi:hypothetical protein
MDYKKIIKTREMRGKILQLLRFVPDKPMLKVQYKMKLGRKLDLKNPKRFTEKLQWYKLYYRNPIMKQCVNKYTVREYVKSKGLEEILVPLYAHYKWVEDVEWDKLPNSFVIKTQHGGGGLNVMVVPDKSRVNKEEVVAKLSFSNIKVGQKGGGREWAYWDNPTGVVVEELLINEVNPEAGVNDYKIFCYNGKPEFIIVDVDRYIGHKRNFYDIAWNNLHVTSDCPASDREIEKPENLSEMLSIAERLSEGFPFVRVDLYNVDGKVYFGELTFYPWSGYVQYTPDDWDYKFAEDFVLEKYR